MAAAGSSRLGTAVLRLLAASCFVWALLAAAPAHAFDYGRGTYGSGAYNVGQLDPTTTVLASGTNPSTFGDSVRLTATVTPSTATGTVTFKDGSTAIGTATLGQGSGSLTTSSLTAGSHALTAVYGGNVSHSGSTSNTLTQVVNAAASSSSSSSNNGGGSTISGGGGGGGGGRRTVGSPPGGSPGPSAELPDMETPQTVLPEQRGFLQVTIDGRPVVLRDVRATDWFASYVYALIDAGIASGYRDASGNPTGEFGPANPVTYAEIAKMALLVAGKEISDRGAPQNRSAREQWSAPYIKAAEDLQLSVFTRALDVNRPATRGAVAQIVVESLGVPLSPGTFSSYDDLPLSHPHAAALQTATTLGLMSGDTNRDGTPKGTIRPDDPINRAEVTKIIALALEMTR